MIRINSFKVCHEKESQTHYLNGKTDRNGLADLQNLSKWFELNFQVDAKRSLFITEL